MSQRSIGQLARVAWLVAVWVALWGGGQVHRYTPNGVLDQVVDIPAKYVTACAFGGSGGDVLFVTTARVEQSTSVSQGRHAGDLFAVEVSVTGSPATEFVDLRESC